MEERPNISVLLSQALVAFIIECDNEAEHRMPHSTTTEGVRKGPWLTSLAMYSNCLRHMPEEGMTVQELEARVRTGTNIGGMHRWGYISVDPKPLNAGAKGIKTGSFLRLTKAGLRSKGFWDPIPGEIEERWRERFGASEIDRLRDSLWSIGRFVKPEFPDCLPILGFGLRTLREDWPSDPFSETPAQNTNFPLHVLLARALLAFAVEFESSSKVSLAIYADLIQVVELDGTPVTELPKLSGVSKEAIAMAVKWLENTGCMVREKIPDGRGEQVRLTEKGLKVKSKYQRLLSEIEDNWRIRFGAETLDQLRKALFEIVGDGSSSSPLFKGLEPYPDSWRAKILRPHTLPHFPMVLHRGGYPDGS